MTQLNSEIVLSYLNKKVKLPQQHVFNQWKDIYYGVSLHTKGVRPKFKNPASETGEVIVPPRWLGNRYQDLFDNFLLARHPREQEVIRNWRYSQYRPLTKGPFGMLMDIIKGAIFQDSQYTITLPNMEDNNYIWGPNFSEKNLISYFSEIILPSIFEDPNGFVIRIPTKAWYDTSDKVEVDIIFVNSKDILFSGKTDFVFKKDQYAYWISENAILRYIKDNSGQYILEEKGYFATLLGRLPLSVAGGIYCTEGYFDSYFDRAIPAADEFISSFSAEQLIDKEASHPFITQIAEDCDECMGVGDVSIRDNETGTHRTVACPKCNGRKTVSTNPADRIQISLEDWDKISDGGIKVTSPDPGLNRYHREKNNEIMEVILRSLNLLHIDAAQSGIAKTIDLEKLHGFISTISNNIFDNIIYNTVLDIISYRNVIAKDGAVKPHAYEFTLIKPSQFGIKTAADLMDELAESTKNNIPGYIRKKQVVDFVDKRFSGDSLFMKKSEIIELLDDLSTYSADEKLTMRTTGEIDLQELIFSRKLPGILDNLIRTKGKEWFIASNISEIEDSVMTTFNSENPKSGFSHNPTENYDKNT